MAFIAMEELAKNDERVKALTNEEQKAKIIESFGEVGNEVSSDDFAWLELLERTKETDIIKNKLNNFILILENDINLKGRIVLYLIKLTKLSNLKFTLRSSPSHTFCEMLSIRRHIYYT